MWYHSKKIATHTQSTPQAIPIANYERNPSIACWKRFRGVFQRCVETTLESLEFYPPQKKDRTKKNTRNSLKNPCDITRNLSNKNLGHQLSCHALESDRNTSWPVKVEPETISQGMFGKDVGPRSQRTPENGKSLKTSPIYPYSSWVFMGYYPQESLYKPYKYHRVHVR